MDDKESTFEEIIDAYLAYLQVTFVNPTMDRALSILQKFALDAQKGKIVKDKIRFGAPWKHPPRKDDPFLCSKWEKFQLMDFIQSLVSAEFGQPLSDDPCVSAMIERFENLKKWKDPGTFTEQDLCPTNGYSRWIMCITQLGQVPYLSFRFNKLFKASGYQVSAIVYLLHYHMELHQ
ncbi:hypothetical protein Lser_V15G03902 [Lactuca serriola]